jgi:hypothetical protein
MFNRFEPSYLVARSTDPDADPSTGYFHAIEDAFGEAGLDTYEVFIEAFPMDASTGAPFTSQTFYRYVRTHINDFVDPTYSQFFPYTPTRDSSSNQDEIKWLSSRPLGALITIDINVPTTPIVATTASVLVTVDEASRWVFTTWKTPADDNHPISGSREFAIFRAVHNGKSGHMFRTRAADRITALPASLPGLPSDVLEAATVLGQDLLWQSLQQKMADFINANGGRADVVARFVGRYPWNVPIIDDIKDLFFSPSTIRLHPPQIEVLPF